MTPAQTFTVQIVEWSEHHDELARIRTEVFVNEQNVPAKIVMDELDATCVHAAAYDPLGNLVGTGRLVLAPPIPRIGRMAVQKVWRNAGVGGGLLTALCDAAKQHGFSEVMLHSQTHATPFYYKHGFLSRGPEFFEASIPHQEMRKQI